MSAPGLGYEILGAVKVKDGLFIGDELAAQDLEFVVANKVTRVINCCGRQVPNHWEPIGVIYLTYFWVDADNQIVLDPRDVVANEIFRFIEEALEGAESVLIHSVRGQSRSCCVLSAYMMKKYNWGLRKTMEFLSSRRPDLNLKPSFLQQLSGYERRLMSQSKQHFSLDWNEADFTQLESEELLLRNTYLNSQMGPLAEFHDAANFLQGKPKKLAWLDNNMDDKIRLEKPAGADKHNAAICNRNQPGQPAMKSVLRQAPKHSRKNTPEQQSLLSRPTTASSNENPQEANPHCQERIPFRAPPEAPPGAPSAPSILGQPLVGGTPGVAHPAIGVPHTQQVPGPPGQHELPNAMPAYTFTQNVPTAWGVESQGMPPGYGHGPAQVDDYGRVTGNAPGPAPGAPYPDMAHQQSQPQAYQGVPLFHQRGPPANGIRDSLLGLSRRDSPEPGMRSGASRDPSPQQRPRDPSKQRDPSRDSPQPYRNDSPLRLMSRSGRGSSPTPQSVAERKPQQANGTGGYNTPQYGNLGLSLGGIRPGPSPGAGPGLAPQARGAPPGAGGPGMGAFRSGGPIRAKANLMDPGGSSVDSSQRRSRPTTPTNTVQRGSGSRPASPLGGARASGSRPSSPQTRPSSPGASQQQQRMSGPSSYSPGQGAGYSPYPSTGIPLTQIDKTKQRSLSSHMRRAPSPTPAFNRNPSPSRPRWRS